MLSLCELKVHYSHYVMPAHHLFSGYMYLPISVFIQPKYPLSGSSLFTAKHRKYLLILAVDADMQAAMNTGYDS